MHAAPALPTDWQAYADARARAAAVERADPRQAIGIWYGLFKDHPELDAWISVLGVSALVRLHYEGVRDAKTAFALCDWAMKQYAGSPALARVVADKADLLLREKRPAEAEALVAAHRDLVARSYHAYTDAAVRRHYLALEQQGKEGEALELLARVLREVPQLLDEAQQNPHGWIYNRLVHSLMARGQADEALSWAKARFAVCRYEPAAMERSGRALVGAWAGMDPARRNVALFLAALRGPEAGDLGPGGRNPLAVVPMPAVDRKAVTEILTRLQGGAQLTHDRISLHLLAGNVREAVAEARRLITDSPEQPAGALELCRVLKALELNTGPANALLAYLKDGTGADPLPAALQPYGLGVEPLSTEKRAVQRTALAQTPPVPGDALADAIGRPAPLPEVATGADLPAALPAPALVDAAALPAAPAPAVIGVATVPPPTLPMPGLARIEVAIPTRGAPQAAGAPVAPATPVVGIEGARPIAAAVPAGTGFKVPATAAAPSADAPAPGGVQAAGTGVVVPAPVGSAAPAAPAGIALPTPVSANTAAAAVALARLAAGEIAPEAAWEEGKLTADDVLRALEALPIWGQDAYANALTGLLVTRAPERVKDTTALSAKLRVSLARYFGSIKDARCVPLWEGLLRDPATDAYVEMASAGLTEFYRASGDERKAGEVCLEGERRSRNPAVRANCLVDAARSYLRVGDRQKATELYARVSRYGYGWATGMAQIDLAGDLIARGRHDEARKLLAQPVEGKYAEQIRVGRMAVLASSYYATGDFEQARALYVKTISQYRSLDAPLTGEGLEAAVNQAEGCIEWAERWKISPIQFQPDVVHLSAGTTESAGKATLRVLTHRRVPLTINALRGAIQVADPASWEWTSSPLFQCAAVVLSAKADNADTAIEDTLVIKSSRFPACRVTVPVHISPVQRVRVRPQAIFLGVLSPGSRCERTVTVVGDRPFEVTRIDTTAPWIEPRVRQTENTGTQYALRLIFNAPKQPTPFFEGDITVTVTGLGRSMAVRVPYSGAIVDGGGAESPREERKLARPTVDMGKERSQ